MKKNVLIENNKISFYLYSVGGLVAQLITVICCYISLQMLRA